MKLFVAVLLAGALVASAAPVVVDQHDMHADSGPLTAENALVRGSGQGLTAGRLGFAFLRPPPYRQCAGSRKQRAEGRAVAAGAGRRRRSRLLALSKQELILRGSRRCAPASAAILVQANPAVAFVRWQAQHGKSYKSAREAERRRGIFAANAGAAF